PPALSPLSLHDALPISTDAPFSASASPSQVMELTPDLGDAATASCPCSRSLLTSFDPISPLPPITTIFIIAPPFSTEPFHNCQRSEEHTSELHHLGISY